jgi:two-component system, NarL family, sensor kinase
MLDKENLVYTVFYILLFLVLAFTAIFIFIYKARNKVFAKEMELKELDIKFQKELLLSTIITQEQERERIAKDLHDEISSLLNIQSLHLYGLKTDNPTQPEKLEKIETLLQLNNKVVESARTIAHNLLPPVLQKFGLHMAIEELILDFEKNETIAFDYSNTIDFANIATTTQLHVFRIIQELINNSIKHGKATLISLTINQCNQQTMCTYTDNGKGFVTNALDKSKGLGMHNIESRIAYLNGSYTITSTINKGITFIFYF